MDSARVDCDDAVDMIEFGTPPRRARQRRALAATLAGALLVITAPALSACSAPRTGDGPDAGATPDPPLHGDAMQKKRQHEPDEKTSNAALTLEEVAAYPRPGATHPTKLAFTPDDARVTYLRSPELTLTRQLYDFDPAPRDGRGQEQQLVALEGDGITEENLSREEKLRRERQRVRGLGITRYDWAREGDVLLYPLAGELHLRDRAGSWSTTYKNAAASGDDDGGAPPLDARLSRDGRHVAFVQGGELMVADVAGDKPLKPRAPIQSPRAPGTTRGLAEYIAQEEMDRDHGYWWSHDGELLAFAEVDETHIPSFRIVHQGAGPHEFEDHRYPFAGEDNARVRLGVVPRTGGAPVWMQLGEFEYLARVNWTPDGALVAQVQDREQSQLRLIKLDPRTGAGRDLLIERSSVWINLHHIFKPLEEPAEVVGDAAGGFVWASERSGFRHLYLYSGEGEELRQLTMGPWQVDGVVAIDEPGRLVYFLANRDDPTQKHLYSVPLAGGAITQITTKPGTHDVVIDHARRRFIDVHSSVAAPETVTLRELSPRAPVIAELPVPADPRVAALKLPPPQLVTLQSRDNTTLHGAIYSPDPDVFGDGPYPTMISVYGGPHAQRVQNNWAMTVDMRAQYLAAHGVLVFKLDNRGSSRRGLDFEGALKHDMGNIEVKDQVDGVDWLVAQKLTDPDRVGIYGWSYG
ncbi:MAG: DPP IV N-terminal domain-containing protein, partial [Myxococcales bacterium]|nr:DPP IV N-terminal domain-containing protein [Myxococcales bacterium]